MENIVITNKKIIEYYKINTNIDIEKMNLLIIELYENMKTDITGNINKITTNEILRSINSQNKEFEHLKNELNTIIKSNAETNKLELSNIKTILTSETSIIKDSISKINTEIIYNVITKFEEFRNRNIEEIKNIIELTDKDNINKIMEKIEKENKIIIDKTTLIIGDVIPKHNLQYYNQYEVIIKNFKEDLKKDILDNKSDISIEKLNNILADKYNSLITSVQQQLITYISSSEERIRNNINDIKDITNNNKLNQDKLNEDLSLFLSNYKISSKKGEFGEQLLNNILSSLFPSSEIINTSGLTSSGDFILKRSNKVPILFENKNYDSSNVPKKEVDKFIYDIETQNCSGIMISQKSGITLKNNFEIDINNGNVLVYIHNMNYDSNKIMIACDIIDHLTDKLKNNNNNNNISNEILSVINDQYQFFIRKKEQIINQLNEHNKQIISSINELELSELNIFLSKIFASTKTHNLECNICNNYIAPNNRSLSNHKRYCQKKNKKNIEPLSDTLSDNETINETVIEPINETVIEPVNETVNEPINKHIKIKKSNKKIKENNY